MHARRCSSAVSSERRTGNYGRPVSRVNSAASTSKPSSLTPSLFLQKKKIPKFVQLDHEQRRRDRVIDELAESGRKVSLTREVIVERVAKLEGLLPELSPRLDKMKASDWVALIKDVDQVAIKLVVLKTFYPTVNLGSIIGRSPKFLLQSVNALQDDAKQVRVILGEKLANLDAVIEAVPDLMRPRQAALTLSNLRRWFPTQDPHELLQKNPRLLYEIEEADLDPDPTYGWTSNFFNSGSITEQVEDDS